MSFDPGDRDRAEALDAELSFAKNRHDNYLAAVSRTAEAIRSLADQVERTGRPNDYAASPIAGRHTQAALRVVHDVQWGVANLHLDRLVEWANEADGAERGEDVVS